MSSNPNSLALVEKDRIVSRILRRGETLNFDRPGVEPEPICIKYSKLDLIDFGLRHLESIEDSVISYKKSKRINELPIEGALNGSFIPARMKTKDETRRGDSQLESILEEDEIHFDKDNQVGEEHEKVASKVTLTSLEDESDYEKSQPLENKITLLAKEYEYKEDESITTFKNANDTILENCLESQDLADRAELIVGDGCRSDVTTVEDKLSKINYGNAVTESELEHFKKLVRHYEDIFVSSTQMIPPPIKIDPISIDVGNIKPISLPPRQVKPEILRKLQQKIEDGLREGSIKPTTSPWAAPLVIVVKKTGDIRITADYREINKMITPMKYSVPSVMEVIERFDGCKIFSAMDCASGFTQIPLSEQASNILAFTCPLGNFAITRLAQGYRNSPAIVQCAMNKAFSTHEKPYFDDFAAGSDNFNEYYKKMERVFKDCRTSGVSLSVEKSYFCCKDISLLGFKISANGKTPEFKNKDELLMCPEPKNMKEVLSFMGSLLYYRHSIPGFAARSAALYQMNESRFHEFGGLTVNARKSFINLKEQLNNLITLPFISDHLPFTIILYSNSWSINVSLCQELDGKLKTVSYSGRVLNQSERTFNIVMIEVLALLHAVKIYEAYLLHSNTPFVVFTRYSALSWVMNTRSTHGVILNWSIRLSSFSFVTKKVSDKLLKEHTFYSSDLITPDELGNEVSDLEPLCLKKPKLPSSCLSTIPLYTSCTLITFDGSYTISSGISAHGFAAWSLPERQFIFGVAARNAGKSVNEAEYHAVIEALKYAKTKQLKNIYVLGDSQLIVSQIRGSANILKAELQGLKSELDQVISDDVKEFYHIPRRFNFTADFLSKLGKEQKKPVEYDASQEYMCATQLNEFWDELDNNQPRVDLSADIESATCFVTTRSSTRLKHRTRRAITIAEGNSNPAANILEGVTESNSTTEPSSGMTDGSTQNTIMEELDTEDCIPTINIEANDGLILNTLRNMQQLWPFSKLLILLLQSPEDLTDQLKKYSHKSVNKAKFELDNYILDEFHLLKRVKRDESSISEEGVITTCFVVPPGKFRTKILIDFHTSTPAAHFGYYKTLKRISKNYFRKGMNKDIESY